ncbi:PREDICTED: SS18-like protein 2 isoform X1 [Thamnophis sirtalis]|uniref:SS18-like protein 2 isoform X1 n=1 Tax=Thamnophis sirtalis TaxID=35019 RepID=A0A6I9Z3Z1_9SAUR|nr:PREDICTED: SS18-like protein 2 isoform X1 [Thamnophis sirtalis]
MSVVFVPERLRGKAEVNQETLRRLLEENDQLIRCIVEYQNKGRATECLQERISEGRDSHLHLKRLRAGLPVKEDMPLHDQ